MDFDESTECLWNRNDEQVSIILAQFMEPRSFHGNPKSIYFFFFFSHRANISNIKLRIVCLQSYGMY